jgi:hypothetical protein
LAVFSRIHWHKFRIDVRRKFEERQYFSSEKKRRFERRGKIGDIESVVCCKILRHFSSFPSTIQHVTLLRRKFFGGTAAAAGENLNLSKHEFTIILSLITIALVCEHRQPLHAKEIK